MSHYMNCSHLFFSACQDFFFPKEFLFLFCPNRFGLDLFLDLFRDELSRLHTLFELERIFGGCFFPLDLSVFGVELDRPAEQRALG